MSKPRRVVPGYVEVCSRTFERRLALLPRDRTKRLLLYVYACAAEKYAMSVHAVCAMGNHVHILMHDNEGRLPLFMSYANGLIARALNALYGRSDKFWSAAPYGVLRPQDREDLLRRYTYILANPSAANLVRYNHDYPGLWTGPRTIGTSIRAERPDFFFSEDGDMPDVAWLHVEVPQLFSDIGRDALCDVIAGRIRDAETRHRAARRKEGVSVMGPRRLAQVRWDDTPESRERWFQMSPGIAAHDVEVRTAALRELERFRQQYRAAWLAWREGDTEVQFPRGSWWMPRFAHARCQPPP